MFHIRPKAPWMLAWWEARWSEQYSYGSSHWWVLLKLQQLVHLHYTLKDCRQYFQSFYIDRVFHRVSKDTEGQKPYDLLTTAKMPILKSLEPELSFFESRWTVLLPSYVVLCANFAIRKPFSSPLPLVQLLVTIRSVMGYWLRTTPPRNDISFDSC